LLERYDRERLWAAMVAPVPSLHLCQRRNHGNGGLEHCRSHHQLQQLVFRGWPYRELYLRKHLHGGQPTPGLT